MTESFNYTTFSTTPDLSLFDGAVVVDNAIALANVGTLNDARAIFRTEADTFDEDWEMEFHIVVGPETSEYLRDDDTEFQADGWAIVWAPTSDYIGQYGGDVGYFDGPDVGNTRGLAFRLWEYLDLIWSVGGVFSRRELGKDWRGDKHYWVDYDSAAEELRVYYSSTTTKPTTPDEIFTGVTFGDGEWYLGITSATGSASMNASLKSWSLDGTGGIGWGITL